MLENHIEILKLIYNEASGNKAENPLIIDITEISSFANYICLFTATSERHAKAMTNHLQRALREAGYRVFSVEGYENGQWILLDYGDIIIHIFIEAIRNYYDLDSLWNRGQVIEKNFFEIKKKSARVKRV